LYNNLDFIGHNPGGKYNDQNARPQWQQRRISLGGCTMSPETRYKRSRDNWKQKAANRAEKNRYQSKELARGKAERDRFKKELREIRGRVHELESQDRVIIFQNKVDLAFFGAAVVFGGSHRVPGREPGAGHSDGISGDKKKSPVHRPSSTG
jgi:hypothetical protein